MEQRLGIQEIRELVNRKAVRLSTSDKGGEFVIIPRQLDEAITINYISDTFLYRISSAKEYRAQYRRLNKEWTKTAKSAGLTRSVIACLKNELPVCPVLYLLVNT